MFKNNAVVFVYRDIANSLDKLKRCYERVVLKRSSEHSELYGGVIREVDAGITPFIACLSGFGIY